LRIGCSEGPSAIQTSQKHDPVEVKTDTLSKLSLRELYRRNNPSSRSNPMDDQSVFLGSKPPQPKPQPKQQNNNHKQPQQSQQTQTQIDWQRWLNRWRDEEIEITLTTGAKVRGVLKVVDVTLLKLKDGPIVNRNAVLMIDKFRGLKERG
jgi:hypothetical protein